MNATTKTTANSKGSITWSPEQQAIFAHFANVKRNLVVEALAGTGKTTTIKEAFSHAPEGRMLYAVFNKRNQKEAAEKITDPRVEVKTLHSLGYAFIKRVWKDAKPDDGVEFDRVLSLVGQDAPEEVVGALVKLVGFGKNCTISPTVDDLVNIAEDYDVDAQGFEDEERGGWTIRRLAEVALNAMNLAKTRDAQGRISFNDMVWLPVAMNWVRPWFGLVCVDEAQDMNLPQLTMARLSVTPGGRVIVVGDSHQAIYGFRGAATDGMGMMREVLSATTLGLTVTYRCPKRVVDLAHCVVPNYQAAPTAPEGEVDSLNETAMLERVQVGDAILSRINAPLMSLALRLIRKNVPARIEGRDIGKTLLAIVKSLKARSVPNFVERVEAWGDKQRARFQKSKNAEAKIERVNDTVQTLLAVSEAASSVSDIEARIKNLFEDSDKSSRPAVVLSSVHKAKGLEWERVWVLKDTFRFKGMTQATSDDEEANIYYVAVTRSKRVLTFIDAFAAPKVEAPKTEVVAPKVEAPIAPATPSPLAPTTPVVAATPIAKRGPSSYDVPAGMVARKVGDVIKSKGVEYVVTMVNDCRAIARCLSKVKVEIENRFDDSKKEFERTPREISISTCCDPSDVLRRMSSDDLQAFLSSRRAGRGSDGKPSAKLTPEEAMAKKSTAGKSELIHGMRDAGKTKTETWEAAKAKFPKLSKGLFDKVWDRKAIGQGGATKKAKTSKKDEAKASTKKGGKKGGSAKGKKSSTPPPPPAPKAPTAPPPPPPPPVAATPATSEASSQ